MKKTIIYLFLFISIGLAGCGLDNDSKKDLFVDSLTINEDGSITQVITESFDRDYYSVEELEIMVKEDIKEEKIELISTNLREDDSLVSVVLEFKDVSAYEDYSLTDVFYGKLSEAFFAGKVSQKVIKDAKTGEQVVIDSDFIQKKSDLNIIIMKDNMNLYPFGDVLFVDDNANYTKKGNMVSFKETNQKHIVIFK